jgi:hypothetical protein
MPPATHGFVRAKGNVSALDKSFPFMASSCRMNFKSIALWVFLLLVLLIGLCFVPFP